MVALGYIRNVAKPMSKLASSETDKQHVVKHDIVRYQPHSARSGRRCINASSRSVAEHERQVNVDRSVDITPYNGGG